MMNESEKYLESDERWKCCACPVGSCNYERSEDEYCSEDQIEFERQLEVGR